MVYPCCIFSMNNEKGMSMHAESKTVLVLRTCDANRQSYGGFQWPESGEVAAPDRNTEPICGFGLHGLLWGCGNANLLDWSDNAKWLVVAVDATTIVDLDGKVKFPRGNVVYCGDRCGATTYIAEHGGNGKPIVGARRPLAMLARRPLGIGAVS